DRNLLHTALPADRTRPPAFQRDSDIGCRWSGAVHDPAGMVNQSTKCDRLGDVRLVSLDGRQQGLPQGSCVHGHLSARAVYDACGIYVLIRSSCRSLDDISNICQLTAILLVPLAVAMMVEQVTARNMFSALGNVGGPILREGRVRAAGPFGHPILAGT